jgi:hypothetical protein
MSEEALTFSYTIDLDCVTMKIKSIAFVRPLLTANDIYALHHSCCLIVACSPWGITTFCCPEMDQKKRLWLVNMATTITVLLFRQLPLSIYGSTALVDLGRFFSFLIHKQSVRLLGRGISSSQGRYRHTELYKHRINAHGLRCLEWDSNPRSQCSSGQGRFMR